MTSQPSDHPDVSQLVTQLENPRTRREARQALVAAKAVDALLECLTSGNESVVWAAVESLGQLRAAEAVEPLVGLLERDVLPLDVAESLMQITGQDHGVDPKQWRAALANLPAGGELDVLECVKGTADLLGCEPTGSDKSFQFQLSLPGGRRQKVAVYFGREDNDGHKLVVVYSECGPAAPSLYEKVLRLNLSIPAGAFAIRDIDGAPHFVMVGTMLAELVTPRVLAKRIENIAARADSVEKSLTKEDRR
ncbi:MAG: HEAT repeat domain-containing protein [Pirellulales bacterium]|nr:HEAT repeat domain-containing protein [Pirellulales bacterium]